MIVRDAQLMAPPGQLLKSAHSPLRKGRSWQGMYGSSHDPHGGGRNGLYGVGAGGVWAGVAEHGIDLLGNIFGGKGSDNNNDAPPVIIQLPPEKPAFNWTPVLIGGGVLVGAYLLFGRGRR